MALIIGETLNGTIPLVGKAIKNRDETFIISLAAEQEAAGANYLDVNAGGVSGNNNEIEDLVWLVTIVQKTVKIPLVIDSSNSEALKEAIKIYNGACPILSSATGEKHSMDSLIPLALKYDCALVALCMDEKGIPSDVQGRVNIAKRIIEYATSAGMKNEDIYIDPLVMTMAADMNSGPTIIQTLNEIKKSYPNVGTITAPSNISYGMPNRRLLNRSFISMLISSDISGYIVDIKDRHTYSSILAAEAIMGRDISCKNYLNSFRKGTLEK